MSYNKWPESEQRDGPGISSGVTLGAPSTLPREPRAVPSPLEGPPSPPGTAHPSVLQLLLALISRSWEHLTFGTSPPDGLVLTSRARGSSSCFEIRPMLTSGWAVALRSAPSAWAWRPLVSTQEAAGHLPLGGDWGESSLTLTLATGAPPPSVGMPWVPVGSWWRLWRSHLLIAPAGCPSCCRGGRCLPSLSLPPCPPPPYRLERRTGTPAQAQQELPLTLDKLLQLL